MLRWELIMRVERCMGRYGLGVMNKNGHLFSDFFLENGLVIGEMLFNHKEIHRYAWVSPDSKSRNQIDHVAVNEKLI
jgi:hypothetical protein